MAVHSVAFELTAEATEDPLRTHPSSVDESVFRRQQGGTHHRYKAGSPPRSEPVSLPSDGVGRAIDYFDFGPTKDAVVLVPDLNRHVLSLAVDAEGVRQVAQVSPVSQPLHGPVDRSIAAMPTASGVTAPTKSPYLNPLPNRKRSGRPGPAAELPGLPARPLAALTLGTMVGSAGAGVRRASRRATTSSRQLPVGTGSPYRGTARSQPRRLAGDPGEGAAPAGLVGGTIQGGSLSSLYAPSPGQVRREVEGAADACDLNGAELGTDGSSSAEGLRQYYLSRYAPQLHISPVPRRQRGAAEVPHTAATDSGAAPSAALAANGAQVSTGDGSAVGALMAEAPVASDQLDDYLHLLHHRAGRQSSQQHLNAPLQPTSSLSSTSDSGGATPSLDPQQSTVAGTAASNPLSSAQLPTQKRRFSLAERSSSWRRSLAPDVEAPGARRASSALKGQLRATVSNGSGVLADETRHIVHTVTPELTPRVELMDSPWSKGAGGGRRASTEPGGVASAAAAAMGDGAADKGPREEAAGVGSSRAGALRGRPRIVQVDPELVRQYTERPPKLCTPNNASRPVTSSDFAAFKNHTVNRSGAPNTLRTPLGSAATGAAAGGSGGPGGAAAAEARGVTPLSALLGPPWLPPAMRPKSPHLGIGGVTRSATSVPGLFVPLELDPPARSPSGTPSSQHQSQPSGVPGPGPGEGGSPSAATSSTGLPPPPSQAPVVSARGVHAGPAHVTCGAGELGLDVSAWLTPVSAPGSELCGVFYGDEGGDSVALMSRVVKGTVQCDLGWAEVSESLMFMSTSVVPNAVLRFALPHRAVLQRFAATIGGTTMIAEAITRNSGNGLEVDEEDEDDDSGPGKLFSKAFGRRNNPAGPGGRAPMLRVPLGRVKGDIFVTVSYLVQLESSGNTLSLTHVCNWTPPRSGWHLMTREQLAAEWCGSGSTGRRGGRQKSSDLYDLSFELEILSHRGLNLVSGPRHMTIKPNYDALLIQGFTQVWRPRHVTQVIFEVALPVPVRSFAILHDARKPDADVDLADAHPRRPAQQAAEQAAAAASQSPPAPGASGEGNSQPSLSRSRSLKLMIQPSNLSNQTTALLGGELGGAYNGRRPQTAADAQRETWSRRNCVAVTFVPGSHFSPADLEGALGEEVAPGPRAQAAALRAGLPGTPPPVPAELLIIVDCCGPTGMASHLIQMLQTLLLLLRSLPAADVATAAGAGGAAGAAAAAAAIAAAGMFNVVICPGAPPPADEADGAEAQPNPLWPPELVVLHSARRQQQQQLLQQHLQATGQSPRPLEPPRSPTPSQGQGRLPAMPPRPPSPEAAAAPVWLFPGGSRAVTGEAVESAMNWVATLLTDVSSLVAWAQPISRLHSLLSDLDRLPRSPGCRRAAVLLCQQLKTAEEAAEGQVTSVPFTTPFTSNANSRVVSRSGSRRSSTGRIQSKRSFSRSGMLRGPSNAGRSGPVQTVTEAGAEAGVAGGGGADSEPTSPSNAPGLRRGISLRVAEGPHVAFGSPSTPTAASPSSLAAPPSSPAPLAGDAGAASASGAASGAGQLGAGGDAGDASYGPPNRRDASPGQRPRSSFARGGHSRSATGGGTADGVRWSYGVEGSPGRDRQAVTDVGGVGGDSDGTEASARRRGAPPSPTRSDDEAPGAGSGTDIDDGASSTFAIPDPPDLDFPVFVVVHSLLPHSHSSPMAGAGGAMANGPSYLMAYQLYQRHLEGLLYERAREEVQQVPMSYLEILADSCGGFVQAAATASELGSSLVLAAACACSGRYLRGLRLEARGAALREQYPPTLPAALPLSEPLSLLLRLSRMQQGAALVLHGVWPSGRPVSMDVSVDPKLKTTGTLLPVLCALSDLSVLLKEAAPLVQPPRPPSLLGYTSLFGSYSNNGAPAVNVASPSGNVGGGLAAGASTGNASRRSALNRSSTSHLQLEDSANPAQIVRLTPKQQAARKRAMDRAIAFNLMTPFTAMALVSMTLAGNRGLIVQTLQTTGSKPADFRAGNFLWPSPIMTVLAAAAKEAAAAAAQAQAGGAAAAFHTAATFAQLLGPSQAPAQQESDLSQEAAAAAALLPGSAGGGSGDAAAAAAAAATGAASATPARGLPAVSLAAGRGSVGDDGGRGHLDTLTGSEFSDSEARPGTSAGRRREGAAAAAARHRSLALLEMSGVLSGSGLAALRAGDLVAAMGSGASSFLRRTGSGVSSHRGVSRRSSSVEPLELLLGLGATAQQQPPPPQLRQRDGLAQPLPPQSAAESCPTGAASPPRAAATATPGAHPSSPAPAPAAPASPQPSQAQQGGQSGPPPPASAVPPALPLDGIRAASGPIGPPMTAVAVASSHLLAVLGRLALLQQVDGSWPAGPELEDLVVSNGRHLHVPMLGGPRPTTHLERHAADAREARLRESLSGLREHTLRGAITGSVWATVLVLALLRAKYGSQRRAWIAMEAKAFSWLQRKWPPPVVCAVSPPVAIMKVSALL